MTVISRQGVTWADNFGRANVSPMGGGWTVGNGTTQPAISSNAAACTTTTGGYYPAIYQQVRTDRMYAQVQLGTATSIAAALLVRCNVGFTQQVGGFFNTGGSAILLVTTPSASSNTTEASNSSPTWSTGQYATMTAAGTLYTLWQSSTPVWTSGTAVLSWTDSSSASHTGSAYRWVGLAVQYASGASTPLKNFVAGDY